MAAGEIALLEGLTVVYKSSIDLYFYVIGSAHENEVMGTPGVARGQLEGGGWGHPGVAEGTPRGDRTWRTAGGDREGHLR